MSIKFLKSLPLLALLLVPSVAVAGKPGESLGREWTTVQRMQTEHLAAAQADVERIAATRRGGALQSGLNDYRAILHAHADDASHTGGTRPEMLTDAKRAGVDIIMLTDHFRPPRDFMDGWRGVREGVLFIPGSETNGFLIHPMESMMEAMGDGAAAVAKTAGAGDGLVFLSHVEERVDHSMDGLTGMEVYNRHADAMDDMGVVFALISVLTDPAKFAVMERDLRMYPNAMLAMQLDYPELYFKKWDAESQVRPIVGIAANDCHHNQVFITKMVDAETVLIGTNVDKDKDMRTFTAAQYGSIRELTRGHEPGDILARLDFDPYWVSFHNVSTHVLAEELNETAVRRALKSGHAYVSHDWMCDPTGFVFGATNGKRGGDVALASVMGDEVPFAKKLRLVAEFPVECDIRLIRNGEVVKETHARDFSFKPKQPGVYRIEGWLTVDTEQRPWIYSNPIYVR